MRHPHLTKNLFTGDETAIRRVQDDSSKKIVFISYRRTVCDKYEARKCAEVLEDIPNLHSWLDENDDCMQHAHADNDDLKKAVCIERGLDVSSALLGIIGPGTFESAWIPYEIGGARGRQRYSQPFQEAVPPDQEHPLIAHLIHGVELHKVPGFVGLGTPLTSLDEVEKWAKSVAEILQPRDIRLSSYRTKSIQNVHEITDISVRNIARLRSTLTP